MKNHMWCCPILFVVLLCGCTHQKEESIPLASDIVSEEEDMEVIGQVDSKLNELEFAISDQLYRLPLKYEDAVARGWQYNGDETKEIEGESYITEQSFTVNGLTVKADITNFSAEKRTINQCYIGSVLFDLSDNKSGNDGSDVKVVLAEQMIMLEATIVQIEEVYGQAKDKYSGEDKLTLTYEFGLNKRAVLTFDAKTEVLTGAELCNRQDPEDEELFKDINSNPTDAVKDYRRPEALADGFEEYVVSYGGSLYCLPAPVAEFVSYGWEILTDKSDPAVKAGKYGYVTLSREGQNLYAVVYNDSEASELIENCFVTTLYGDLTATKVPIGISRGIVLGMDVTACQTALQDIVYEEEDNGSETVTYYIFSDEEKLNYTAVTIDRALELVSAIRVVHYPEGAAAESNEITKALENIALVQKGN